MLFLLIPAAWSAVLFLAWAICRLAALSDGSLAEALDEAIGNSIAVAPEAGPAEHPDEQLPGGARRGGFRATG